MYRIIERIGQDITGQGPLDTKRKCLALARAIAREYRASGFSVQGSAERGYLIYGYLTVTVERVTT